MSTTTFVNALIGLARDRKQMDRSIPLRSRSGRWRADQPTGYEVAQLLIESGYFPTAESRVFGDALEILLQMSDPRRKK